MDKPSDITCQAILFDLDGTLVDFAARLERLWKWWAERRGVPLEALLAVMHGRRAVETIRLAAPQLDAEAELEALEMEEITDMHDVHAYPGALELVAKLNAAPWAIVTSGTRRVAQARISHVHLPMPPVLVAGDQVSSGKPAPECYLLAARRLGLQAEDCVVVEDAPIGIEAGKAAGMRVIAIASTYAAQELQMADAVVGALTDIDVHLGRGGITIHLAG